MSSLVSGQKKLAYKSKSGFTLVELLIVIAILAILAVIVLPKVSGITDKSAVSSDKSNAQTMSNSIEQWTSEYDMYVTNSDAMVAGDEVSRRVAAVIAAAPFAANFNATTNYPSNATAFYAVMSSYVKNKSTNMYTPKHKGDEFYYNATTGECEVSTTDLTTTGWIKVSKAKS